MKKLLSSLLLTTSLLGCSVVFAEKLQYYIMIDAGSTGTRLHLFRYNHDVIMPVIEEPYTEKNNVPLASFVEHPDQAYSDAIQPLLQPVVKKLRDHGVKLPIPVSILGTAGMRLLPSDQQQVIYQHIKSGIQSDFKEVYTPKNIQTISGKMEGVYDWLDVNYLLKNFQHNQPTVGSIEIGGGSTQIAFALEKSSKSIDETSLLINSTRYIVFSKSFLGLGLDEARNSMNIDENADYCYPVNYNKGKFDLASCSVIYNQIIDNYAIHQLEMPTYKIPSFVAFAGAYYTYHFFATDLKLPNQETLEQTIIKPVCSNSWETLKEAYPAEPENYLANRCADGIFVTDLLYGAFQLQNKQIQVLSNIDDHKIDWALGAVLYGIVKNEL